MEDFTPLAREITHIQMIGTCFSDSFCIQLGLKLQMPGTQEAYSFLLLESLSYTQMKEIKRKTVFIHRSGKPTVWTYSRWHVHCHAAQWNNERTGNHMPLLLVDSFMPSAFLNPLLMTWLNSPKNCYKTVASTKESSILESPI